MWLNGKPKSTYIERQLLIMAELKIELLYFEDCPHWVYGLENLNSALKDEGLHDVDVQLVLINNEEDARKEKFLGSPSFHFNGEDLWPEERTSFQIACRVYHTEDGLQGYPSVDMLREQIRAINLQS